MSENDEFKNGLEIYNENKDNPYKSNYEMDEDEPEDEEQGEPKSEKDLLEEYFDECDERIARVRERYPDSRLQEILIERVVRPFHYFSGEETEQITDKQKEYLNTLAKDHRRKFFSWCAQQDSVPEVGEIEDRIKKMSKQVASEAISHLNGGE